MRKTPQRSKLAGAATLLMLSSPAILRTIGSTTAAITTGTDNNNNNIADDASSSTATNTDNINTNNDDASSNNTNDSNNLRDNAANEKSKLAAAAAAAARENNEREEETKERILSSSSSSSSNGGGDDPTHHYFCGRGFADASDSCEYPCPSGSLVDCPSGMLCYYDTPCNIQDVAGYAPPTQTPTLKPFDPWAWRPPSQAPWSANDPRLSYYCGSSWEDASSRCGVWCKDGDHDKCPYGQSCFSATLCKAKIPSPSASQLWRPPTSTPYASDDRRLTFFCGRSWQHASETCGTWCPEADDDRCDYGQTCFSDTNCKKTAEPTDSPTYPPPTKRPTLRPTGPSQSPTSPPQPLLPEGPSNNMFCGSDWSWANAKCSVATHCPNGIGDCPYNQYCWNDVTCDVRDFIPWAEGGNLGKPSHQEIAVEMGLSFRSEDPTDHYFCGRTPLQASENCHRPCPDDTPLSCRHGEYCQHDTACDARVMPGFGITEAPSPSLPYDSLENYKFCGMSWAHANGCEMKWCGDGSGCPGEQR